VTALRKLKKKAAPDPMALQLEVFGKGVTK